MMILQAQAVIRGTAKALVVVDMPFGSYEASREQAFLNASRVLKETGAGRSRWRAGPFRRDGGLPGPARRAGDGPYRPDPQAVNTMGGFKVQGRAPDDERRLLEDARAISEAGAFAIVLEGIVEPVARAIATSPQVTAATIGIGASAFCDGQILVLEDMLGLSEKTPKFVRQFGSLRAHIEDAVKAYADAVRAGRFPADDHTYG